VFKPGDLVTFTDNLTLFDGNTCLVASTGKLVKDPYDKPGRQWVVMREIAAGVYENAELLYLLCPIAEGPAEHEGEKSLELPEGTFGLIEHDTFFQRGAATVAPQSSLRPWLIMTKAKPKTKQGVHCISGQPEWQKLEQAFWKLWSKAAEFPVKRWNKLVTERKKTKSGAKEPKKK
jgi:hypothetical protein